MLVETGDFGLSTENKKYYRRFGKTASHGYKMSFHGKNRCHGVYSNNLKYVSHVEKKQD